MDHLPHSRRAQQLNLRNQRLALGLGLVVFALYVYFIFINVKPH